LIARQAGCTITSIDGGAVSPDSVLACAPQLHPAMLDLLASASSAEPFGIM
jgi:fructose-1,6-bisphosphatase/inositol monophosphatase family enzyme